MQWWSDGKHLYTPAEYGRPPVELVSIVEVVVEAPVQALATVLEEHVESPTVEEEPSPVTPVESPSAEGLQPGEMWSSRMANERARRTQLENGMEVDFEAGGFAPSFEGGMPLQAPPTPGEEATTARAMVAGMQYEC